ncbi:hypothetical protein SORBI_3009G171750 [Sorghum bicolor]|uniref:Uncharacterized protein n=1 Tax=Sorghum bicolor TaxID=4558 RepID=C5YZQ6_SORBI|nr:hypothetical protein SORBI_3009G171750 [Sorghum bicolor]
MQSGRPYLCVSRYLARSCAQCQISNNSELGSQPQRKLDSNMASWFLRMQAT